MGARTKLEHNMVALSRTQTNGARSSGAFIMQHVAPFDAAFSGQGQPDALTIAPAKQELKHLGVLCY